MSSDGSDNRRSEGAPQGDGRTRGTSQVESFCTLCVEMLPVEGAAVAVFGADGDRETVYFTDNVAGQLGELQFSLGEGPSVDAVNLDGPVLVGDLEGDEAANRWPGFGRGAAALGVRAAFAFPLRVDGVVFAVLEMYNSEAGVVTETTRTLTGRLIDAGQAAVLTELVTTLDNPGQGNVGPRGRPPSDGDGRGGTRRHDGGSTRTTSCCSVFSRRLPERPV